MKWVNMNNKFDIFYRFIIAALLIINIFFFVTKGQVSIDWIALLWSSIILYRFIQGKN
ncbi:hypothetical protein BI355_2145 [Companilactobacillus crustorum]|uniref:Uncharacterized protein n=1 Tax=Companilactobacillus crustorum JCM 15951 TaxID=1423737 RepID=A0A837RID5_9LACO|nr:hypothetical protein BI355_2145 [Companilactobacillus crustorum]KRK41643.1 hypothetical protein FD26_GL001272 [Companilactobacillus crustorum JCM 15951]